ncbi:MAG TPA: methylamine utilization protein, partial [Acidobacteria bacterium]|nr:methylamine utilization protein [Acidobacteriota bacterium]
PASNPTTNAGATLGRVLFYDTRLSANDTVSCGSCHLQQHGFSDPRRYSLGFDGRSTRRHAMSLTNARYYARGRFFWDERSTSLEAQVLEPIQDPIEMGLSLDAMREKLARVPFYRPLFERAFGTTEVTVNRVSRALAQFVRALVSAGAPYDRARAAGRPGSTAFNARLSATARLGHQLFVTAPSPGVRGGGCSRCHVGDAQISLSPRNIGLDPDGTGDPGANDGR